jgi:uncharacterized protein (TIGR03086 family)
MELTEALDRALDQTGKIVAGVSDEQLSSSTPCDEFDLRELINHTVVSTQFFAEAANGNAGTFDMKTYGTDVLGKDFKGAFERAASDLRSSTKDPAVLKETLPMPWGDSKGEQIVAITLIEEVQHGWDIARASGQQPTYDKKISELAFELAQKNMPPDEKRTPDSFGPSKPCPDGAPAVDQLAAFLGRTV